MAPLPGLLRPRRRLAAYYPILPAARDGPGPGECHQRPTPVAAAYRRERVPGAGTRRT